MKNVSALTTACLAALLHGIISCHFADTAHDILHMFETKKIRSSFAKELHEEIARATNDFTECLTARELEKYVDTVYLDYMAAHIAKHNTNTYIALVWPVTVGHDAAIETIFNKYCNILYSKRILLDSQGAANFLAQIPTKQKHPTGVQLWFAKPQSNYNPMRVYLIECKENNTDYGQMKKYLTQIFSNKASVIDGFEKQYGKRAVQNLFVTTKCKHEIRNKVHLGHAMHVNDMHDETVFVADIVFNENSIKCLRHSNPAKVKGLPRFNQYTKLLKEKFGTKIENDLVVYNSAVLSAFGLRDCNDVDFLHDPRIKYPGNPHPQLSNQNQFFKRLYVILEDMAGKHCILEDAPHAYANVNLDTTTQFKVKISIDDLLYNPRYYFHFHRVKYATLEFMHYFKKKRGRPKDLRDVALIEELFASRNV